MSDNPFTAPVAPIDFAIAAEHHGDFVVGLLDVLAEPLFWTSDATKTQWAADPATLMWKDPK